MLAYRVWNPNKPWQRFYAAQHPGEDGVDWGYVTDRAKARNLSPYWERRFAANARRCGDEAHFEEAQQDVDDWYAGGAR